MAPESTFGADFERKAGTRDSGRNAREREITSRVDLLIVGADASHSRGEEWACEVLPPRDGFKDVAWGMPGTNIGVVVEALLKGPLVLAAADRAHPELEPSSLDARRSTFEEGRPAQA